jgi:asparagine synthetase B (glutamine-hydrolysing)
MTRDRIGVKPLFYRSGSATLTVASEPIGLDGIDGIDINDLDPIVEILPATYTVFD